MGIRTLASYTVEEILPFIGEGCPKKRLTTPSGDYMVKMASSRLECFKRNQTCVTCKITGNIFLLQTHNHNPPRVKINCHLIHCEWCRWGYAPVRKSHTIPPHLNLFYKTTDGRLTLMTQDHILPKSRGGSDRQDNLQTMCSPCNNRKGDKMPGHNHCGLCFAFPDAVVDWDSAERLW